MKKTAPQPNTPAAILRLRTGRPGSTLPLVQRLTKQEQMVLCIMVGLLLTGWAVKMYRAAHPPAQAAQMSQP